MIHKGKCHGGSSWSLVAVVVVCAAGSALTLNTDTTRVQNAIGIVSCAALAGIIIRSLHKANDVVDAALRLAEEIANVGRDLPEVASRQSHEDGTSLATVIPLPGQRAAGERRSEVS
jgi:hypothetical protein